MHEDDDKDIDATALQRFADSSRRLAEALRGLGAVALGAQLAMLDLAEALDPGFSDELSLAEEVIARAMGRSPPRR